MDTRYEHPLVADLWSPNWTYETWLKVEVNTLVAQLDYAGHPVGLHYDEADHLLKQLAASNLNPSTDVAVKTIGLIERRTHHDVAAFLEWVRGQVGEEGKWLHYGLTSSDVVDTTQGVRFKTLHPVLLEEVSGLLSELARLCTDASPLLARTHGQVAEPTQLHVRARHWMALLAHYTPKLSRACVDLSTCKLSGPVGTFVHNPPRIEQAVASRPDGRANRPTSCKRAARIGLVG